MARNSAVDEHIVRAVQEGDVHEQAELQEILRQMGYEVPQATLSRRLKKLNIAKVSGIYRVVETERPTVPRVLHVAVAESGIIALFTAPANARSLGYFIDGKYLDSPENRVDSGIIGTMAGGDTLLLILKSPSYIPRVLELLRKEFPYLTVPQA